MAPDYQRQGIGRRLLEELLSRYPGVGQVVLLTDDTPATVAFYERAGFGKAARFGCVGFVKFS